MHHLHKGAKWLFRVQIYSVLIFLFVFFGIFLMPLWLEGVFTISPTFIILPIAGLFLFILLGELFVNWAYKNWKYEFTEDSLKIEKGIIVKRYKSIPYQRIQNVDITRGILARIIGFSTIDIQTAGYSMYAGSGRGGMFSEGHIPAISIQHAEEIRDFLIEKISHRNNNQGL
ncbi:MAG TPA: PH domain-containing protein [Candidatus Pacearchaeota archaeon]|nr:PH domain-containing protein [Candidatus Pacearchaeota archaeon]